MGLNWTSSFHSPLTVLLSDLRALETSTENNGTVLVIVLSLGRLSWLFLFLLAHATHRIRFEKRSSSLSEPQSPVNTNDVLANSEEINLALLILDFGDKETKLGNPNAAFRFNLKIT